MFGEIISRKVVYRVRQFLQPELFFKLKVHILGRVGHELKLQPLAFIIGAPQVIQYVVSELYPQTGHL